MLCRSVLTAAQLLSEGVSGQQGSSFAAGFDWAAEQLRQAGYEQLAAEVRLGFASWLQALAAWSPPHLYTDFVKSAWAAPVVSNCPRPYQLARP